MKRNARGYLSQVAEPVLPNQPLLSARRGAHWRSAFNASQIPVVQESKETSPQQVVTARTSQFHSSASQAPSFTPLGTDSGGELPQVVVDANRGTDRTSKPAGDSPREYIPAKPDEAAEQLHFTERAIADSSRSERSPDPAPMQPQKYLEHTTVHQFPQSVDERRVAEQQKTESPAAPSPNHRGRDVPVPAAAPLKRGPVSLVSQRSPEVVSTHQIEPSPQQRLQFPRTPRSEHHSNRHETRVHIGTIEVRSVISQPTPMPVQNLPQQVTESPVRHSGVQRPAEPLARPLAWSFGLVQG